MSLDDNTMLAFIQDMREDIGQVKAGISNLQSHMGAVSRKADDIRAEQRQHEKDPDAHPSADNRKGGNFLALASLILSGILVAAEVAKAFLR